MRRCMLAVGMSIIVFINGVSAENTLKKVAVLPFEAIDITAGDVDKMCTEITTGFSSVPEIAVVTHDNVMATFRKTDIIKDSTCRNRVCLLAAGRSLQADIAFIGSAYKIGNKYSLSLSALNCADNSIIWSKDYSCECALDEFMKKTSYAVVFDARSALFLKSGTGVIVQNEKPVLSPAASAVSSEGAIVTENADTADKTAAVSDDDEEEDDEEKDSDEDSTEQNRGVVNGFTFGGTGRYVVGSTGENESEWSYEGFVLYPTSQRSHVRAKFSLPMSTSDEILQGNNTYKKNHDYLISLDHEWGFRKVGLTIGLAYMYFQDFYETYGGARYHYDQYNRMNWVLGIRAGKPGKGFRGRISYPMTFSEDDVLFLEYSAFGMFGNDRVKGGLGIQGSAMRRKGTNVETSQSSTYYDSYYTREVSEFYFMGPCGKLGFLAGSHSVVTFGIDFMGIIMPDVFNLSSDWTPSLFAGLTFSLGKIKSVESFDGRF